MNSRQKPTKKLISTLTIKSLLPALTLCASMSAQATIVTYTFSGTVDDISDKKLDDPETFGFAFGDIIFGIFSVDDSLAPTGGSHHKSEYTNGINFSFTVATASGTEVYTSEDTASDAYISDDIEITVEDNKDKFKIEDKDRSFRGGVTGIEDNNSAFLLNFYKFKIEIQDSSKSVFSDSALPLVLDLNDFDMDHRKMELKFTASGGKELKVKGVLDSLTSSTQLPSTTDTVVPVPTAAWFFFSAIGGLGFLRQRRQG